MKYFIADKRIPKKALGELISRGFTPILLPPSKSLSAPVSAHPDMLIFFGDRLFCAREYYNEAKKELDLISKLSSLKLCLSDAEISKEYPNDIAFNALFLDGAIYGKLSHLCSEIKEFAVRAELELINVRQGYTKCSVCRVTKNAIITSDGSIKKAALERGVDVLSVTPGHVTLPGYDCGFIGGASGSDEDHVYFCGDLSLHPDGKAIADFCQKHKKEAVSLSDEPLFDIGTLFFV